MSRLKESFWTWMRHLHENDGVEARSVQGNGWV